MDIKKEYEAQMRRFFDASNQLRTDVYKVFPTATRATIDDIYHSRKLADKIEEALNQVDELAQAKKSGFYPKASMESSNSPGDRRGS